MSSVANWSYTSTATIWRRIRDADGSDTDGGGQPYGWEAPIAILCDYQGGLSAKIGDLGREIVVKNTIWTEYATARKEFLTKGFEDTRSQIDAAVKKELSL